ncbi:hypothetical protein CL614_08055 [archaeon]|mgnify:CR=1 FL=1|nr:hypothetical protein [archaeon]|tara:strand:+ start:3144 stop:3743 length:600 start_codon:yes stop_codon:yes gene_type:complete
MSGLETLQEKLIQAKRVMDAIDGKPSNKTQHTLTESNLPPVSNNFNTESIDNVIQSNASTTRSPITEEKVRKSNLPDAIKKLMIDHPIPEVSFGNQIPDSLIEGAAEKMKKLSGMDSASHSFNTTKKYTSPPTSPRTQKITQSSLKNLVRETIKESLDELIDERISKKIVESGKLNESIKLVVGNTIFEGKILTTKKIN